MHDTPSAQLIPFGEVQRLVQERRRHPRATDHARGGFRASRNTSQVRRLLQARDDASDGPRAA